MQCRACNQTRQAKHSSNHSTTFEPRPPRHAGRRSIELERTVASSRLCRPSVRSVVPWSGVGIPTERSERVGSGTASARAPARDPPAPAHTGGSIRFDRSPDYLTRPPMRAGAHLGSPSRPPGWTVSVTLPSYVGAADGGNAFHAHTLIRRSSHFCSLAPFFWHRSHAPKVKSLRTP